MKGASVISLNFEGPEGSDLQPIDQDLACHWFSQDNAAGDGSNLVVSPSPPVGHLSLQGLEHLGLGSAGFEWFM